MTGGPVKFPFGGAVSKPTKFGTGGYANGLDIYQATNIQGSPRRAMVMENYGYGIYDLSNPTSPVVLGYQDMSSTVPQQGDGQSIIISLGVSNDGTHGLVNWKQSPHGTFVMKPNAFNVFDFGGDFPSFRASGGVVADKVGNRYIGYALTTQYLYVADVTTFLTASAAITANSIPSEIVLPTGASASSLNRAGHFIVYANGSNVVVIDGSNPGPINGIVGGLDTYTIPAVAFGLGSSDLILSVSAAIHPANNKLYIMAAGANARTNRPTGIGVVSTSQSALNFTAIGGAYHPTAPFDASTGLATNSSAAIPTSDDIYFEALMQGGTGFKLFTLSANAWGTDLSPNATIDTASNTYFNLPQQMRGFASGNQIYSYVAAQGAAYILPLTCTASNSPAVPDLQVSIDNGDGTFKTLTNGGNAYIGDKLRVTPSVSPNPSSVALTGWRFDYDLHASEDNGSGFPRLKTPDLADVGGAPPSTLTLNGPCDPAAGGDAAGGTGCWASVTGNSAFGGPDYAGQPAPGSQKTLRIALEAQNSYGAGYKAFDVNWVTPTAKLKSSSALLGGTLQSGSDGHPKSTGFKWYFGSDPNAPSGETLTQDTNCTGPTCAHVFAAKGSYNYWLTVPYANGYTTADCSVPCTSALGSVTVTDVVLDFAPQSTVAVGSANFNVTNNSTVAGSVTSCNGGYQYSICDAGSGSCADGAYSSFTSTAGSVSSIPAPAVAGTYWLRIRYTYSTSGIGGCTAPLTAQWEPGVASDSTAWPILVSNVVPTIKIKVNGQDPCPPGPGGSGCGSDLQVLTTDQLTAYAYVDGALDQNPPPISWTFGAHSSPSTGTGQGAAFKYTAAGTSTVTMTGYGAPITATVVASTGSTGGGGTGGTGGGGSCTTTLAVSNVTANPNPANVGDYVRFTASTSGACGSLNYSWNFGDGGTSLSSQPSHPYQNTGNYSATVTISDGVNTRSGNVVVSVQNGPPPPTPIDFQVKDTATGALVLYQAPYGWQVTSGQSLTFVSVNASGTITWDFGDGSSATGGTATHTYVTSLDKSYTVKLTANSQTKQYGVDVAGLAGSLSGTYSAKYADGTGLSRSAVTGGKLVRFTASDDADSYDWDFGDGSAHGSGKTADHAYTQAGTFLVKLTVTKAGNTVTTPSPLSYTVTAPPAPTLWLMGGMAYTDGASGTFWQSDLSIFNPDTTRAMLVSVAFLSGTANTDPTKLQWTQVYVGPQSTKLYKNVLSGPPFGLSKGSFGAILVRGDDVPASPVISGRTYNSGGGSGTYGLSLPAVPVTGGVRGQSASAGNVLIGLREKSGDFHTNLTIANLAADYAQARVQFLDAQGSPLGSTLTVDLAPYGVHQINRALTSPPSEGGAGATTAPPGSFSAAVTLASGTSVFPYASVINDHTGDPIVVTASAKPAVSYRVPGIVRTHGKNGTLFKSDLTIYNTSSAARSVRLRFWYQSVHAGVQSGVQSYAGLVTLKGQESMDFKDFVKSWLPSNDFDTTEYANSYVDVSPADGNNEPLLVLGQTYNDQPGGSVGFQVPGYTAEDGVSGTGTNRRLTMTGLASGASYRTNVAVFLDKLDAINVSAGATVRVIDGNGQVVRSVPIGLSDDHSSFTQVNDDALFGGLSGDLTNMTLLIDSVSGSAPIAAYATVIDNISGDAVLVPGQPTP
jgi:PKD repeat protein